MFPTIRQFPSDQFYDGLLTDHESILSRGLPPHLQNLQTFFRSRAVFFDLQDTQEQSDESSKCNRCEAQFTRRLIELLARLSNKAGSYKPLAGSIGVISPYRAQVRRVKDELTKSCNEQRVRLNEVFEVNTVDGFQGREKEIIIFNCVRSNDISSLQSSLGFLLDERRLNVAITRPQHFLFVIGNAKTLSRSQVWSNMVSHHQKTNGT